MVPQQFSEILAKISQILRPDLNVMDFAIWGILARKACENPHKSIDSLKHSLKRSLRAAWDDIDKETISVLVAGMLAKGSRPWWRPGVVTMKINIFF